MRFKTIDEILSKLIDLTLVETKELNDFSTGSIALSFYEAIAMELEQYYTLTNENIQWGIEQGIYESFGFYRKEARKAYGRIELDFGSVTQSVGYIAKGSLFKSSITGINQTYETLEDYVIPKGTLKTYIRVYCTEPGVQGNVPKGTIDTMMSNMQGVRSVTNIEDFLTGADREPIEKVKTRFRHFIATRGRATKSALEYATLSVEDVVGVYIHEQTGYIRIYAHDLNGDLPDDLKANIENAVEGDYRPIGIKLEVFPVVKKPVELLLDITLSDVTMKTPVFRQEIEMKVKAYLNNMTASDDLILSDIIQEIMNIDESLIYDVKITNLTDNIIVDDNELIRAGQVAVNFV